MRPTMRKWSGCVPFFVQLGTRPHLRGVSCSSSWNCLMGHAMRCKQQYTSLGSLPRMQDAADSVPHNMSLLHDSPHGLHLPLALNIAQHHRCVVSRREVVAGLEAACAWKVVCEAYGLYSMASCA